MDTRLKESAVLVIKNIEERECLMKLLLDNAFSHRYSNQKYVSGSYLLAYTDGKRVETEEIPVPKYLSELNDIIRSWLGRLGKDVLLKLKSEAIILNTYIPDFTMAAHAFRLFYEYDPTVILGQYWLDEKGRMFRADKVINEHHVQQMKAIRATGEDIVKMYSPAANIRSYGIGGILGDGKMRLLNIRENLVCSPENLQPNRIMILRFDKDLEYPKALINKIQEKYTGNTIGLVELEYDNEWKIIW